MGFDPDVFIAELEATNDELQIENSALIERLSEMERCLQQARLRIATLSPSCCEHRSSPFLSSNESARYPYFCSTKGAQQCPIELSSEDVTVKDLAHQIRSTIYRECLHADVDALAVADTCPPRAPRPLFGSILVPAAMGSLLGSSLRPVPASPDVCCGALLEERSDRGCQKAYQWMFRPPPEQSQVAMRIRSGPSRSAEKTAYTLQPFSIFSVSQEVQDSDGVLYLKLMDGRGWVFDRVPDNFTLCVRLSVATRCDVEKGIEDVSTSAWESDVGDSFSDDQIG